MLIAPVKVLITILTTSHAPSYRTLVDPFIKDSGSLEATLSIVSGLVFLHIKPKRTLNLLFSVWFYGTLNPEPFKEPKPSVLSPILLQVFRNEERLKKAHCTHGYTKIGFNRV